MQDKRLIGYGRAGPAKLTGEHDERDGVALVLWLKHVRRIRKRDGSSGRGETSQDSAGDDAAKSRREDAGYVPDVDEEEGQLHDGPSAKSGIKRDDISVERAGKDEWIWLTLPKRAPTCGTDGRESQRVWLPDGA